MEQITITKQTFSYFSGDYDDVPIYCHKGVIRTKGRLPRKLKKWFGSEWKDFIEPGNIKHPKASEFIEYCHKDVFEKLKNAGILTEWNNGK